MGSVQFIPVSLAALIYYTYPIMVTLLGQVTGMEKMHGRDRTARFFVVGGQALSLAGLTLLLGLSWSSLNGLGVLLAFFAALSFTLVLLFGSRLMQEVPPMVLNLHVAVVNVVLFTAVALLGKGFIWPTVTMGWLGLAVDGSHTDHYDNRYRLVLFFSVLLFATMTHLPCSPSSHRLHNLLLYVHCSHSNH